ncbi:hypothetical protein KP509_1Z017400 [Ceratopteris richardii]|nr:hypothetical protein KP509_1Z017400 [Ceratopteris richardii]
MQDNVENITATNRHGSTVDMADVQGGVEQNASYEINQANLEGHKHLAMNDDGMAWYRMKREPLCWKDAGMWRGSFVELIASLVLTFVSVAAVIACLRANFNYPRIAVAITQFLIYTSCIVAAAPLSGAYLNPSFSFACILIGHISPVRGLLYIMAQSAGSVLGALLVRATVPANVAQAYYLGGCLLKQQVLNANLNSIASIGADSGPALVAEFLFSFLLIAVALPLLILCPSARVQQNTSFEESLPLSLRSPLPSLHQKFTSFLDPALLSAAFIIGVVLGLLIFISGELLSPGYTSAGMNPARCFGPAVAEGGAALWQPQWVFWLGPFLAAFLFALLYEIIFYNHPHKRSYTRLQSSAPQNPNIQTTLPVGSAAGNMASIAAEPTVEDIKKTFNQMSDVGQASPLADAMQRRMDVFLHIKATMQQPDGPAEECDKSISPLPQSNSNLSRAISMPTDVDDRHVTLEYANLSLRDLAELSPISCNSPVGKLGRLFKDTEE